jgi:hypothetical protein
MKKTIITITGAAFLGLTATTLTPAPASAFAMFFFVPFLASHQDPNFKAVNPYQKKVAVHHSHKHSSKKMSSK